MMTDLLKLAAHTTSLEIIILMMASSMRFF